MFITWLDVNSWLIELADRRILLDPWLVDTLVFNNLPWLIKGVRPQPEEIPANVDLILLSQGLEDHAHPPTLERLNRALPVVASPKGAKVAEGLDFVEVTALAHGEEFVLDGAVSIKAFPGAPIGPFLRENGYLIRDLSSSLSLYYEPHGYPDDSLRQVGSVDVVITPIVSLELPLAGPIIRGQQGAIELAEMLNPQILLPTAAAAKVEYEGILPPLIQSKGGADELRQALRDRALSAQLLRPAPGERLELALQPRVAVA
ncbi:MAG: MBL fold metallo-hydrolase [Leptolyngbyaceae cyanobacterium SM1_1_3]|nr:MBL fold metallo-hydrolase [Leptolyngbyaceae cyanobacterium SM1_1_3]NJN04932.1 MBL fold metallo-hydrolase [Leptolyngbyaceae cyanobacterium RM1_1_2]NJO11744.1 MBL fold metallo-hydrolase [Leptolyngbyaceae cyanobacterium SL_1_1]